MIDENKIYRGMKTCLDRRVDDKDERELMRDALIAYTRAFYDALGWFKQNLWHDASEEPKEKGIVLQYTATEDDDYCCPVDWVGNKSTVFDLMKEAASNLGEEEPSDEELEKLYSEQWKSRKGLTKWCYLSDLLPKGDEQ